MSPRRADFTIVQGDRLPSLTATLRDGDGVVFDLDDAVNGGPFGSVRIHLWRRTYGGGAELNALADIVNPPGTDGLVRYDWADGDTDRIGWFELRWEAVETAAPNRTVHFPSDTADLVRIYRENAP